VKRFTNQWIWSRKLEANPKTLKPAPFSSKCPTRIAIRAILKGKIKVVYVGKPNYAKVRALYDKAVRWDVVEFDRKHIIAAKGGVNKLLQQYYHPWDTMAWYLYPSELRKYYGHTVWVRKRFLLPNVERMKFKLWLASYGLIEG